MRVRHATDSAVLVDREDALRSARSAPEGLLDGVPNHALSEPFVEAREALGGLVVDREDEAEVDRLPEPAPVLDHRPADRGLVAAEGPVARTDSVELSPLTALESFFTVRDVANLLPGPLRAVVVLRLDEEHLLAPFLPGLTRELMQLSFRLADRLLPLVGADRSDLGEKLVLAHLQGTGLHSPVSEQA